MSLFGIFLTKEFRELMYFCIVNTGSISLRKVLIYLGIIKLATSTGTNERE